MPNAYANKVQVVRGGVVETIVDLTSDTVAADKMLSGYTAHDASGASITGSVSFSTYYTSTVEPTSSQGSDGDIWLVM